MSNRRPSVDAARPSQKPADAFHRLAGYLTPTRKLDNPEGSNMKNV